MKQKLNLALITGGHAAELEISLKSAQVVSNNLNKETYTIYRVDISQMPWQAKDLDGNTYEVDLNGFTLHKGQITFDAAFIAIHGTPAEDGKLQGYLELMNVPYAACGVLASAITFDKDITKQLLQDLELKQAKSVLLTDISQFNNTSSLTYPLFVKPNKNGSSYGVSKVKQENELQAALEKAFNFDDEVLVEEFIAGRELANGIFEVNGELVCLPVTEIISENEFFDYEAKYQGKSKEITPAPITEGQLKRIHSFSKEIYKRLKLKGAVRVDYFLKGDDLYLLEVNTIPGLSEESILPQQAKIAGYSLEAFFDIQIRNAIKNKLNE